MRILQLTNKVPYPPRDGGAIASLTLARGLAEAGEEVTLLAMNTTKHFLAESADGTFPELSAALPGVRIALEPVDTRIVWWQALGNLLFSRLPYNAVRFRSGKYRTRLLMLLRETPFDVIILDQVYTGLYLDDIRSVSQVPVVLRAHNLEHEIWSRTAKSSAGLKRLYLTLLSQRIKRFELSLLNRYDALIPITRRDAAHFEMLGNKKPCHVLQAAMDVRDPVPGPTTASPVSVAHLGALDWLPNQDGIRWFIRNVWPLIRKELPEIEFHLAGRNAPEKFASQVAAPGVIFHGEVESAGNFIHQHPIFIVPLFSGSGMRIKLLDYLASGRATVTTTIGAEGIPIENGREAIVADKPEEFASHIVELARDSGQCARIGEQARQFIRNQYDNRVLTGKLIQFLKSIENRR